MRLETKYFIVFSSLFILVGIISIFLILLYNKTSIKTINQTEYIIGKSDLDHKLIFTNENLTKIIIPSENDRKNWKGSITFQHFYDSSPLIEIMIPSPLQLFIVELEKGTQPYNGKDIDGKVWFEDFPSSSPHLRLNVLNLELGFVNGKVFVSGYVVNLDGLTATP